MKPDATKVQHKIERISYAADLLVCSCGSKMAAHAGWDWAAHRSEMGMTAEANARKRKG